MLSGGPNEVWSYGDEVYEICKKYMFIRENLKPYLRDLMQAAHEKGTPVMRTLFYEFPNDSQCWDIEDQYMFGSDILVAPVMEAGLTLRAVYLPAGVKWKNAWTDEKYEGGQSIEVAAPLEIVPLFIKDESNLRILAD